MRLSPELAQYRDRIRNSILWNIRLEDMDHDELLAVIGYLCDRAARRVLGVPPIEPDRRTPEHPGR